jgi:hypothetical protein
VVSGGLACVAGALLLGAIIPALRHASLHGPVPEDGPSLQGTEQAAAPA